MGILNNQIVREGRKDADSGASLSFTMERRDTFSAVFKELSALIESREDEIEIIRGELKELRQKHDAAEKADEIAARLKRLEKRLEEAAAREAIWMTVLEWYAAGPFGGRAGAAVAQAPSEDAARIRRERELLIAPLLRSETASRDGRGVKISFRSEEEAKAFRKALEQFVPTKPYFGLIW